MILSEKSWGCEVLGNERDLTISQFPGAWGPISKLQSSRIIIVGLETHVLVSLRQQRRAVSDSSLMHLKQPAAAVSHSGNVKACFPNSTSSRGRKGDHIATQKLLAHHRIDADCFDSGGYDALLLTVRNYHKYEPGVDALHIIDSLLSAHQIDVNRQDRHGRSALWYAVDTEDEELVESLVHRGRPYCTL